ncbi:ATP-binding protein [Pseudomonas putida]|uniref:ATP-binding protein n=1 Tax=Pseudomonas putida TaxID=303 RepID=UPI003305F8CB
MNIETHIREVKEKFIYLQDHLQFTKAQRESEQLLKQTYLDEETAAHDERALALTQAIHSAQFEIDSCDRNLKEIEAARLDYERKGVEDKRARTAQKAVFEDELRSVGNKLNLALGAAQEVKAKYEQQINEENRLHNEFHAVAIQKADNLREEAREAQSRIEAACRDALKVVDDSSADELQRLVREAQQRHGDLVRAQVLVANPPVDPSIRARIDNKNLEIRDANKVILTAQTLVGDQQRSVDDLRGNAPVQLTWCVDELKAIDAENIVSLCNYLGQNRITLCTAFPDPDAETLMLFEHKYKLDAERRLVHCELALENDATDDGELELAWEDGE